MGHGGLPPPFRFLIYRYGRKYEDEKGGERGKDREKKKNMLWQIAPQSV